MTIAKKTKTYPYVPFIQIKNIKAEFAEVIQRKQSELGLYDYEVAKVLKELEKEWNR